MKWEKVNHRGMMVCVEQERWKDCGSCRARLKEADLPKMERVQSVLQKVHSTPPGPGFSRYVAAPGAGPSGLTHIQVFPGAAQWWWRKMLSGSYLVWMVCLGGFAALWYITRWWLDGQVNGRIYSYAYSFLAEIEMVDLVCDFNKCKHLDRKSLNIFCWCFCFICCF